MVDTANKKKKKRRSRFVNLLLTLFLLAGVGLLAYPTVSDAWNSYYQSRAIIRYADNIAEMNRDEIDRMLAEARDYNHRLLSVHNQWRLDDDRMAEYRSELDLGGTGIMGYINIESIRVSIPIMHGTSADVLQTSIGHLEGSSLPCGAQSWDPESETLTDPTDGSHSVLSGHRGLPSARLFTDLDQLAIGDLFTISILDEELTYQVDQILIVLPDDVSSLTLRKGHDYCTLVTCTPYSVNSHRLLVRGHRVGNVEAARALVITPEAVRLPNVVMMLCVGIPMLIMFLTGLLILTRRRPVGPSCEEIEDFLELRAAEKIAAETAGEAEPSPSGA